MEQAVERRDHWAAHSIPPIVDQDVERFKRSNRVPPHVGNEYGVTGLEFGDLGRRGCLFKARVARKVGIVGIDQADRYALRGEFEGPNIEVFQLLRRKQYKATTPVSHAGDVVIEIEMR